MCCDVMGRTSAFLSVAVLLVIYVVASTGLWGVVSSSSTLISSCTDIHEPGYYILASDLNGLQEGVDYCIQIYGNGIVFDGGGHSLIGNLTSWPGIGVRVVNSSNVTIRNVRIAGYNYGIYFSNSSDNVVVGNVIMNNAYGVRLDNSSNNVLYNNLFSNKVNVIIYLGGINYWNITKTPGRNIVGGDFIGGNYWGDPRGSGFSDTCADADEDGICDEVFIIDRSNIDYLPLKKAQLIPDLTISITYSPAEPIVGQQITLKVAVGNIGLDPAGEFNVSVCTGDITIGEVRVQGLEVGETIELAFNWIPALPGLYIVEAFADSDNEIAEANEANNKANSKISVAREPTPTTTPTETTTPDTTPTTPPTTTPTETAPPTTPTPTTPTTTPIPPFDPTPVLIIGVVAIALIATTTIVLRRRR